jgi:hypothetical protein
MMKYILNNCIKMQILLLIGSILVGLVPLGGAQDHVTLTGTIPPIIEIIKPQDKITFKDVNLPAEGMPPITREYDDNIIINANTNWALSVRANHDYMKSVQGNIYLTQHLTAQVQVSNPVQPVDVMKELQLLFQGIEGQTPLVVRFTQTFSDQDEPGSYKIIVTYEGTAE